MMTVEPDHGAVCHALKTESARFADLVRSARHLDDPVPGLTWTTGEVVAHVASTYRGFAATVRGEVAADAFDGAAGPAATAVDTLVATNAIGVGEVGLAAPSEAARILESAAGELLAALAAQPKL